MVLCQACKQMVLDKSWISHCSVSDWFQHQTQPSKLTVLVQQLGSSTSHHIGCFSVGKQNRKKAKVALFLPPSPISYRLVSQGNGPLEWTTGIDTGTCSIVATKACEHSEAALNWKFSVVHIITFLKFNTYMDGKRTGTRNWSAVCAHYLVVKLQLS